jgi:hypothetical protein
LTAPTCPSAMHLQCSDTRGLAVIQSDIRRLSSSIGSFDH